MSDEHVCPDCGFVAATAGALASHRRWADMNERGRPDGRTVGHAPRDRQRRSPSRDRQITNPREDR